MPDRPYRYAVIPTYNRPDVLLRCLAAACAEADTVYVIDNGDDPGRMAPIGDGWYVVGVPMRPPNLSKLWNIGLNLAAAHAEGLLPRSGAAHVEWDVAVLNDDAIIPPGWFTNVSDTMRTRGAKAGSFGAPTGPVGVTLHKTPGTTSLHLRMQGHAFLLAGEAGLRADERLSWWCGDNDLDMQARQAGGTVILAGDPVEHLHPDQSTRGELAARTAVDMATFVEKWRFRPW